MSNWLSVIIVLLIIGIILDGLRRARNSKREDIRLSNKAKKADSELDLESSLMRSSVFPSGGARVKKTSGERPESKSVQSTPKQSRLELEDPVPMLMDSVDELDETESDFSSPGEPSLGELKDLDQIEPAKEPAHEKESHSHFGSGLFSKAKDKTKDDSTDETESTVEEILIINVMAPAGEVFAGQELFDALMAQNLKFGHMNIFHRHLENDGDAPVIFSLANIIEPGNFNFAEMETTETPGLCFFLSLPTACEGPVAYEDMVATAKAVASQLGGDLKDENRSALTNQTIEHGRQRVIEFERKNKLKK